MTATDRSTTKNNPLGGTHWEWARNSNQGAACQFSDYAVTATERRNFPQADLNEAAGAADAARELNHEGSRRPVDW